MADSVNATSGGVEGEVVRELQVADIMDDVTWELRGPDGKLKAGTAFRPDGDDNA